MDGENIIRVEIPNKQILQYKLLSTLEFNSTRKRMSVIVKEMQGEGRILLLSKGADSVMKELLSNRVNAEDEKRVYDLVNENAE